MPVINDNREIVSSLKDAKIIDGKLVLKSPLGWSITYEMDFLNTVDISQPFQNGEPIMFSNVIVNSISLAKEKDALDNKQILDYFKGKSIIGHSFSWKDVLVGFVYGQPTDLLNHTWMLQFRNKQGQIIYSHHFSNVDVDANVSIHAWNDGNWHGRLLLDKNSYEGAFENGPNSILLKGKNPIKLNGDISYLNDDTETIRLRYNIRTNVWYVDFLDKKGEKCQPVVQFSKLASSAILHGHVDYNKPKPWVSYHVKREELGHFMILGETLIMHQRKED